MKEPTKCRRCDKKLDVYNKWFLCKECYSWMKERRILGRDPLFYKEYSSISIEKTHKVRLKKNKYDYMNDGERQFYNLYPENQLIFHPAKFWMMDYSETYQPDFYDRRKNVFIEISGTAAAYYGNKGKYDQFRKSYPAIPLEIRFPNGEVVNEGPRAKNQWPRKKKDK
jgi:hypothetical protein